MSDILNICQKYEVDYGEVNLSGAGEGSVEIMTIHKSKGLEFPIVILAGMGKTVQYAGSERQTSDSSGLRSWR